MQCETVMRQLHSLNFELRYNSVSELGFRGFWLQLLRMSESSNYTMWWTALLSDRIYIARVARLSADEKSQLGSIQNPIRYRYGASVWMTSPVIRVETRLSIFACPDCIYLSVCVLFNIFFHFHYKTKLLVSLCWTFPSRFIFIATQFLWCFESTKLIII